MTHRPPGVNNLRPAPAFPETGFVLVVALPAQTVYPMRPRSPMEISSSDISTGTPVIASFICHTHTFALLVPHHDRTVPVHVGVLRSRPESVDSVTASVQVRGFPRSPCANFTRDFLP